MMSMKTEWTRESKHEVNGMSQLLLSLSASPSRFTPSSSYFRSSKETDVTLLLAKHAGSCQGKHHGKHVVSLKRRRPLEKRERRFNRWEENHDEKRDRLKSRGEKPSIASFLANLILEYNWFISLEDWESFKPVLSFVPLSFVCTKRVTVKKIQSLMFIHSMHLSSRSHSASRQ